MVGCANRTYLFARRLLAMIAHLGNEKCLGSAFPFDKRLVSVKSAIWRTIHNRLIEIQNMVSFNPGSNKIVGYVVFPFASPNTHCAADAL